MQCLSVCVPVAARGPCGMLVLYLEQLQKKDALRGVVHIQLHIASRLS